MKKVASLFLVLFLVLTAVSGCSPDGSENGTAIQSESATGQTTTQTTSSGSGELSAELTLWSMPLAEEFESMLTDDLIAGFNETYPEVKVNVEMMTWEGGPEKLQIALGTGTTPDLYIDGTARTASLPNKNVLVDISDVINEFKAQFYPSLLEIGKVDGKNYILSIAAMNGMFITVNATLAKDLGTYDLLPQDKKSWSYDDFYDFCKACAVKGKADGVYGVALYAGSQTSDIGYYNMMLSNGGNLLNEDHTESIANQAPCVEIVDLLGKLVQEEIASPGAATLKNEDTEPLFFSSKVVTMIDGNPFYYAQVMRQMEEDGSIEKCPEIEAFGAPTADGTSDMRVASWGANTMVLFKNDEDAVKISAAKELMRHYIKETDFQVELCSLTGNSPAIQGLTVPQTDPNLVAMVPLLAEWTGKYAITNFGILEPYWAEIRSTFYPELQSVFNGNKTAQEAMDTFKESIDTILAK